jgi:hypothetical protein
MYETQKIQELLDIMVQYRHIGNLVYYEDAVVYKDKRHYYDGNNEKDSFRNILKFVEKILRLLDQAIPFL